jgi:hypothetical protein
MAIEKGQKFSNGHNAPEQNTSFSERDTSRVGPVQQPNSQKIFNAPQSVA